MRKYFLFVLLVALFSCENGVDRDCIEVELIEMVCGNAVLQVVGGQVPEGVAESWTDQKGNTYQNVFSSFLNVCDPQVPQKGERFYVNLIDEIPQDNCPVCLAMLAGAPEEYLLVEVAADCAISEVF